MILLVMTNYTILRYQCDECDFMANEVITLHVHFGIKHSIKKQCGLCDEEFVSAEELDDHHSHCEIYVCSNSVAIVIAKKHLKHLKI